MRQNVNVANSASNQINNLAAQCSVPLFCELERYLPSTLYMFAYPGSENERRNREIMAIAIDRWKVVAARREARRKRA